MRPKTAEFLREFWREFRYVVDKQDLIDRYETGISYLARKRGLHLKAYAPDVLVRAAFERRREAQEHAAVVDGNSVRT